MASRMSDGVRVQLGRALMAVAIIGLWELGAYLKLIDPFFVSSPSRIVGYAIREIVDLKFYRDLYVSLLEMTLGYVTGGLAGIVLGLLLSRWHLVARMVDPFLVALNSIPRIAIAPLLIMWFGIDMASKVVLAGTLVFFVTFFNTFAGIRGVDGALCNVARVMGATDRQIFTKVMLPAASSWIMTGLKMSLPFALIGVIIGEFMAASQGLGYRLNMYTTTYNTAGAMAVMLAMMALMMILNELMSRIEARVLRWRPRAALVAETEVR